MAKNYMYQTQFLKLLFLHPRMFGCRVVCVVFLKTCVMQFGVRAGIFGMWKLWLFCRLGRSVCLEGTRNGALTAIPMKIMIEPNQSQAFDF